MSFETSTSPKSRPRRERGQPQDENRTSDLSFTNDEDEKSGDAEKDVEKQLSTDIEKEAPTSTPMPAVPEPSDNGKDPSLVEFDGPDDPGNPKNWSAKRRIAITISMGMMVCTDLPHSRHTVTVHSTR